MNGCCKKMKVSIVDPKTPFEYDPKIREYSIVQKPEAFREKHELTIKFPIIYCPFCGTQYPKDLRDEWFTIIKKKFDIDGILDKRINQLPEEFTTEKWWKQRGL